MPSTRRKFLKNAALWGVCSAMPELLPSEVAGNAVGNAHGNAVGNVAARQLPKASWKKLPRWRGFNLLEKFCGKNVPFVEDDFRMISDLGFNFVRLPMDYHGWIVDGDRRKFHEPTLKEIDLAVEYGMKYGVHTMLNFHRAPGYTVAKPQENPLVWDDDETLDICALHWRTFAKRYAGIPAENVSFNLFNEPSSIEINKFMKVHRRLCEEIRAEDPNRLIICDGMSYGNKPTMELAELQVAQATRGYMPMEISHYHATWVGEYLRDMKTPPTWPMVTPNGLLFNPRKSGIQEFQKKPAVIRFANGDSAGKLRFKIYQVSSRARILVEALDDAGKVQKLLFDRLYQPGPGEGEWDTVIFKPEWKCYQNIYHKNETVEIPAGTAAIQLRVAEGDWASIEELAFQSEKTPSESALVCTVAWSEAPFSVTCSTKDNRIVWEGGESAKNAQWHWDSYVKPWQEWEKIGGVMVGEFGAFNQTPHDVVLAWMRSLMGNWKKAGWGWALWNFRGSIGVMNSNRQDASYVDWHGLKMDKKMMDILQEF